MKKSLLIVATASVVVISGLLFKSMLANRPMQSIALPYPLLNEADLVSRAKDLNHTKACLKGTYISSFESSNLAVGHEDIWIKIGLPSRACLNGHCPKHATFCGELTTKAGTQEESPKNINGFLLETSCCGHLSGWSYELQEN